jgi:hypothetical protein
MADTRISALPLREAPLTTDEFPVAAEGATWRASLAAYGMGGKVGDPLATDWYYAADIALVHSTWDNTDQFAAYRNGNFLLLTYGDQAGHAGGWRPHLYYRDYVTTASAPVRAVEHPYEAEGTPKLYVGDGVVMRAVGDTVDLAMDRVKWTAGVLDYETADVSVGRLYGRAITRDASNPSVGGQHLGIHHPGRTGRQRTGEIIAGLRFTGGVDAGTGFGGRFVIYCSEPDTWGDSTATPIIQFDGLDIDGVLSTGLQLRVSNAADTSTSYKRMKFANLSELVSMVFSGGATLASATVTEYYGSGTITPTPDSVAIPCPIGGTITAIYGHSNGSPNTTPGYTCTLTRNGVTTALTFTLSGAIKSASDVGGNVAVVAGDRLEIQVVPGAGVTPRTLVFSALIDARGTQRTLYIDNPG